MVAYYARIEDWVPGGRFLPLATIGGVIADIAMVAFVFSTGSVPRKKETKIALLLVAWLCLSVPFSYWPGGSLKIIEEASKAILLCVVVMHAVNSISRLRALLIVHCVAITIITFASRGRVDSYGRMQGVLGGVFENPNDLGLLIAITVPLVLMFLIRTKKFWARVACALSLVILIDGLVLTFSRTGFVALVVGLATWLWYFGHRAGRSKLVAASLMIFVVAGVAIAPTEYGTRVASIFDSKLDEQGVSEQSSGSRGAREELLTRSVEVSLAHPLLGVGPGEFAEFSGSWHVSHNIYLQFSSESGIPSLILYLLLLRLTFQNVKAAMQGSEPKQNQWNYAAGLRSSLVAFAVATFFSNFGYQFFTYIFFGYCSAVRFLEIVPEGGHRGPRMPLLEPSEQSS